MPAETPSPGQEAPKKTIKFDPSPEKMASVRNSADPENKQFMESLIINDLDQFVPGINVKALSACLEKKTKEASHTTLKSLTANIQNFELFRQLSGTDFALSPEGTDDLNRYLELKMLDRVMDIASKLGTLDSTMSEVNMPAGLREKVVEFGSGFNDIVITKNRVTVTGFEGNKLLDQKFSATTN
jgi:hypothetical protein